MENSSVIVSDQQLLRKIKRTALILAIAAGLSCALLIPLGFIVIMMLPFMFDAPGSGRSVPLIFGVIAIVPLVVLSLTVATWTSYKNNSYKAAIYFSIAPILFGLFILFFFAYEFFISPNMNARKMFNSLERTYVCDDNSFINDSGRGFFTYYRKDSVIKYSEKFIGDRDPNIRDRKVVELGSGKDYLSLQKELFVKCKNSAGKSVSDLYELVEDEMTLPYYDAYYILPRNVFDIDKEGFPDLFWVNTSDSATSSIWTTDIDYDPPLKISESQGWALDVHNFIKTKLEGDGYTIEAEYDKNDGLYADKIQNGVKTRVDFYAVQSDTSICGKSQKNLYGTCNLITHEHFEVSATRSPVYSSSTVSSGSSINAVVRHEETCKDFLNNNEIKICEDVNGPKDDYWGSNTTTQIVKVNTKTNKKDILLSKTGYSLSYTAQAGANVYFSNFPYEGSGNGELYMIDITRLSAVKLDLNVYGKVSPDGKYYVTNGDTIAGDGLRYCTNPMNGFQAPGSSIKLLNLATGKTTIIKEDKNMIYVINKWSDDSTQVIYTKSEVQGVTSDSCPNLVSTYTNNRISI